MAKQKKKEITLGDLAQMTARGFLEVGERFNKVDRRFDRIEEEIKYIRFKLESIEKRVIYLEDRVTEHSRILAEHSRILAEHSRELKEIKSLVQQYQKEDETNMAKIIMLEKRVGRLETKIFN